MQKHRLWMIRTPTRFAGRSTLACLRRVVSRSLCMGMGMGMGMDSTRLLLTSQESLRGELNAAGAKGRTLSFLLQLSTTDL